jgi:tetratricopeptide (TPR) repeat protein
MIRINAWMAGFVLCLAIGAGGCALRRPVPASPSPAMSGVFLRFHNAVRAIESNDPKTAIRLLEGLTADYPDVGVFHHDLGVAYRKAGLSDKAAASYRRAITLDGNLSEAHYNLAIILREQGKFSEAETEYRAALALSPDFKDAHYNLGVLYDLYLDRPAEAMDHYQKYLEFGGGDKELIEVWMAALKKRMEAGETQ